MRCEACGRERTRGMAGDSYEPCACRPRSRACFHDQPVDRCEQCAADRAAEVARARAAALVVLALEPGDLEVLERVRELRRIVATDGGLPGAGTPGPWRSVDRIRGLIRAAAWNAVDRRDRLGAAVDPASQAFHRACEVTWQVEADLLGGLLELVGHGSTVPGQRKGGEA